MAVDSWEDDYFHACEGHAGGTYSGITTSDYQTEKTMADVEWTTPQMKQALQEELTSAIALRDGRVIKTEEGREIIARQIRLLEVLVHGAAKTPLPSRHHD